MLLQTDYIRWMGSIAMDANGTIALGYSTSGSTIRPDIRYTGRSSSDPLGVMTFAETVIYAGGGVQTGTLSKMGRLYSNDRRSFCFWDLLVHE